VERAPNANAYESVGDPLALESDLHAAVRAGNLEVLYQPLVSFRERRLRGVEALVRWRHPELGLLTPAQFLPLAETAGLLAAIDAFVVRAACRQARAWSEINGVCVPVAVNISRQFLADSSFLSEVVRILDEVFIPPGMLELEISEQISSVQLAEGSASLDDLKARGVRLSIDDFGSGWSALQRLRELEVDRLKIDRAFVAEMDYGSLGEFVVRAVLTTAHRMGLDVVAEGIETFGQLCHLDQMGCDLAQGFHLSPPVPASAIPALARATFGGRRAA
jgi:diguanylate cyclase